MLSYTGPALTSGGQPVIWTSSNNGATLTATISGGPHNGATVAVLTTDANGNYTFTLDQALDHQPFGNNGENTNDLSFGYTAKDFDGDTASGALTIHVIDDTPVLNSIEAATLLNAPGQVFDGTYSASFGADGPISRHPFRSRSARRHRDSRTTFIRRSPALPRWT